jgi:hypothetical protein
MHVLNYQGFASVRFYWLYKTFLDSAIVIRKVSTEQEALYLSRTHQGHVSPGDINLLVEPINTEHEERYKATIDAKECIRETRAKCLLKPCNQNAGQSRQPVPRFKMWQNQLLLKAGTK